MSAIGRLWRRAPAWRLSVAAAVAFTALAAMFPPALPWWRAAHTALDNAAPQAAGPEIAPAAGQEPAARYVPQADPRPPDYGIVEAPPLGQARAGIVPFAGRLLPLPSGDWQELILARGGGSIAEQASLLGRIEAGHLTGLMLAVAPGPTSQDAGPVAGIALCFVPDAIAHQVVPSGPGQSALARECWSLAAFETGSAAPPRSEIDEVLRAGFNRLDRMGVAVPGHMLALHYLRSDENGWLAALLLLPDAQDASRRLLPWVRRFVTPLHKGFDGTLTARDLPTSVARDPD